MKTYPLTETQFGMYLEWNADRDSTQYSLPFVFRLPRSVDLNRLEHAIRAFIDSHSVYRTRFVEEDGAVRQFSDPSLVIPFVRKNMSAAEAEEYEKTFPRSFDLFAGPLVRCEVVVTPDEYRLYIEFAHVIADGTSIAAFNAAVSALYRDDASAVTPEEVTFADYAESEAKAFGSAAYRAAAEAAKARFGGRAMTMPRASAGAAERRLLDVSAKIDRRLVDAFCRERGVHPNLFFMGVFARVLSLYANEREVVFYTVNHGRRDARLRRTQGALVKSVPVLGEMKGEASLAEYFGSFRLHGAGDYPFTHFCRDLGFTTGWGFVFQAGTIDYSIRLGSVESISRLLACGGAGEQPTMQVFGEADGYRLEVTALTSTYDADYLQGFADRCVTVAENFARSAASARLREVSLLTAAEETRVSMLARGEEREYDATKTFVELFRSQAGVRPNATAVVDCDGSLTYGELDARSDALAAALVGAGVKIGGFVGVMLPRRRSFVVSVIAVQKCGAGYVPMDADYPAERLAYMLENSEAQVLVTTRELYAGRSLDFKGKVIFFEEVSEGGEGISDFRSQISADEGDAGISDFRSQISAGEGGVGIPEGGSASTSTVNLATPDTPAYMIYTSGSTGKPKGVVLANRALTAMLAWFVTDCEVGFGKKNLSITSFSFDASVPDLFPPLAAGGELHILTEAQRKDLEAIRDYIVRVGATGLTTSTQLGLALVNAFPELPLEYMMLGGEKMVPFAKTPVRMLNGYGPTEFAVCSSYHEVDQTKAYDIPIGRAVPNTASLVVDCLGQLVPEGMTGELALAGPQIAEGYWKLPEKTAQVFVECGWLSGKSGDGGRRTTRMYRTGDLARYNAAGELDYMGRIDFQVKIRGFRIEIGEIEHVAASFTGVGAVAAEVREVAGAKHLVLYYTCQTLQTFQAFQTSLRDHLAASLTSYMVPDFFVRVEAMPMTPNGKIDRKRLPTPQADDEPVVSAETEIEKKIYAAVASVLKTEKFGVTHDFNRLGLTSLGAMALMAKLKKEYGLAVSMKQLTANPTIRGLAAVVEASRSGAEARSSSRRPRRATYPMTENQRGIYADWLRAPDALQYNIPAAFKFTGLPAEKLAAAAEKVIASHPALMTRFVEKDGEIVQCRRDDFRIGVTVEKLDFEPDESFLGGALKPFAPNAEALARGTVYESPSAAYLLLDIHHSVFDGCSVGILLAELKRALDGGEPTGEVYTAFDAALDERDYLESEAVEDDDRWFARYLEDAESTAVSTSTEGADGSPGEAGRVGVKMSGVAISARARELGVTASDWFLTAFTELLKRTGREEEVCINFVTAGRSDPEVQDTVGMFVKTLPLRGVRGVKTFPEAVKRMHGTVQELIARERESYVRLSEKFGVRPEVLFAFEGGIFELPEGCELLMPETRTVKAPFAVLVTPDGEDFRITFEYDRSMYSERDMSLLLGMFVQLAGNAVKVEALEGIPLLSEAGRREVLKLSTGETLNYDATKTVVNLIRANVIARPFATAVVDCDGSITYGELDARSDALAAALVGAGVKVGGFVGVMLPRRRSFVVSVIAVQKCGAGYVPMDADYPAERLAYMLENSEAQVLVTTRELYAGRSLDFKGKVIFFEEVSEVGEGISDLRSRISAGEGGTGISDLRSQISAGEDDVGISEGGSTSTSSSAVKLATPDTPAYMIYTSGSTGKPKGVVIAQRALRHMVEWTSSLLELKPGSRVATHPSFSFDASVIDIFPALCAGGELHIYSEEIRKDLPGMRDYIVSHGIEGGTMSTQIGMTLLDTYPELPLRYLVVGGEKLMPIAKTNVRIINGYGPTEFTVCSSYQEVDQAKEGDIPIGRACPGTSSLIVDRYGQLLPRGFAGELALTGPQLAEGYWKLPEKTAQVFVECGWLSGVTGDGDRRTARMYRTGDLARYNNEGTIDYLGRIDFQVKLRGFRIEIGEIEHVAASFPGVGAVAAEVREVAGAKHLVLYYTCQTSQSCQTFQTSLRDHLAASLTSYMVPDFFVRVEAMPMTPNGKINRKLLPAPEGVAEKSEYVEPVGETERKIAGVYGKILGLDRFGATEDFFSAGGTSLIGIKAVVAMQKEGLDVQYGDLFKYKTPRTLAAFLTGELSSVPVQSSGDFDYGAYDYAAIDKLLAATPTELFAGFRRHSLGDVLLCGATGYLGVHVLRQLLESTDSTVCALIRPKRGISAEKRLDSQFVYYFGEKIPRRFKDRLCFAAGDLTDADLAGRLKDEGPFGTVINCAALVKHYIADDLMDRINVGGVENLIEFCAKTGARLIHASTYSVGGLIRRDSAAVLDERRLYIGQESDNDYVRTKFLAERSILAAVAAGRIRAKIMRLGNLMGRESDGEFQMNVGSNAFVNSLRSYRALGAYPLENMANPIEMSPIDRVAEALCLLATTPDGMCVFHPYNAYALDMGAVIGAMNRRGFNVDWVSHDDFAAMVEAMKNDPSRAAELQGILHYAGHLLGERRIAPVQNFWTTTVLYRLGFRWKPAEDNYLANFLDMLDGLAVFD